jgi:hypothetical protein
MILVLTLGFVTPLMSGELDKPYNPSRKEWLELSLFKLIKERSDHWRHRVYFILWVKEKDGGIWITIAEANGEELISDKHRKYYVEMIKIAVEEFIKRYEWANHLSVFVQF